MVQTSRCAASIGAVSLAFLLALPEAWSQTDERLLTATWRDEDHWADTWDKPFLISRGHLEGQDENLQVFHWDSLGRIKFDRTERDPEVWMGYRVLTVSIDSNNPVLDHTFVDLSLALAVSFGSVAEEWTLLASIGAGTANDGRFDETEAVYPLAALELAMLRDPARRWHLGISLDGNRSLLPDVPLPYVLYESAPSPGLRLRLGNLQSDIQWEPSPVLVISAEWRFPANTKTRIESPLGGGFALFSEANRFMNGFHLRNDGDTRLFYELASVEAGLRFIRSWIDVSCSVGYAFGQRILTGEDVRDLDRLAEPQSRPFVALNVQGTF